MASGDKKLSYLNLWSVVSLGIGSMVGAGIFALMGQATLLAGKEVYWSFLLGGATALLSGYTYARLGARYPSSGGIIDYLDKGFHNKTVASALSLVYLGTLYITVALVAKSFGAYASRLFFPADSHTPLSIAIFSGLIILLLGALNMGGAKVVGKSEVILVSFKLFILIILMVAGLGNSVPIGMQEAIPDKDINGVLGSAGLTFFAFAGYGMMANTAGNLKVPRITLPRAIFTAIGIVTVLYLLLAYVVLTNVPSTDLRAHTDTAIAQAAYPILGIFGFIGVSVAALIATASAINATMFSMLDISKGLASQHRLNKAFRSPLWGTGSRGFFYSLLVVIIITVLFDLIDIANIASFCFLISYLAVFRAHWNLRHDTGGSPLLIISGVLLMLLVLISLTWQVLYTQPFILLLVFLFVSGCFLLEIVFARHTSTGTDPP